MTTAAPAAAAGLAVETLAGGAVALRLDEPGTRNALSPTLVHELTNAVNRAVDSEAPALVLASTGPAFASGVDLTDLGETSDDELRERFRAIDRLLSLISDAPLLTMALLDGPAVGAGADLALACDHRLGTERASFRFPGPRFGLLLGTERLARETSPAIAQDLLLSTRPVHGAEALRMGLLTALHEPDQLQQETARLVDAAAARTGTLRDLLPATRRQRDAASKNAAALLERSMTPGLAERMQSLRQEVERR